jgi:RNase P/RNase MRP subunit p29
VWRPTIPRSQFALGATRKSLIASLSNLYLVKQLIIVLLHLQVVCRCYVRQADRRFRGSVGRFLEISRFAAVSLSSSVSSVLHNSFCNAMSSGRKGSQRESVDKCADVGDVYGASPASSVGKSVKAGDSINTLKTYLTQRVPANDRADLQEEFKKTFPLGSERVKSKSQTRLTRRGRASGLRQSLKKGGKTLTASQRRLLAVDRLPKKRGLTYAQLLPINELWNDYVVNLIPDWDNIDEQAKIRLCRADYHGGLVKVTSCACASFVGLEGLVAVETKNTLVLVGKDNVTRTLPKKGAVFTFRAGQSHVFTVGGNAMLMRPSERAVKKWKQRGPLDF